MKMSFCKKRFAVALLLFLITNIVNSCQSISDAFYAPATLALDVPPGPRVYQDGWRAGCKTALALNTFANAWIYTQDYGNGIFQNNPLYMQGWGQGHFACVVHVGTFDAFQSVEGAPLGKGGD